MFGVDPFLLSLIGTVLLATFVPCHGAGVEVFHWLAIIVIGIMFFLQGARLSRSAVVDGLTAWRLHILILCCTFILFPLLGLGFHAAFPGLLQNDVWLGVLFLCCLPSTVQSSIAFTSIAGGNTSAAVCAATASNIFGIFITPVLVGLILARHGAQDSNGLDIVFQLLLPFIAGQLLQPWIGNWARRHKKLLSLTDRSSILVVVYAAFSDAVMQGLWHKLPLSELGMIAVVDFILLAIVLIVTALTCRLAGLPFRDEVAVIFCGSKKTLASGVPMANVLFPAASVGIIVLPLMIFHQIQLFICAILARRFAEVTKRRAAAGAALSEE
ncbi:MULTISPECIES: bile acid:sodium symporter family protein [Acetobacter]|uniref:Bile acid:sodium symporter n=1 Tax=Acetobacter thailandicus TaxID=1502842 RepID=A0ABT3QFP0_9PROT|nr:MULTISPECIES: bile acid:sodium symporter family protein [Acetobacter]MBS0985287.1 bile acid:sodium symporter [Acetobacter thailandicus]MBS1002688.1 bile acid:sodium symporter [Acetobacter thailandicus]MCX2564107.1 bile acid:sodium symporter [Acetobacter thailandicus]NHN95451.1 bile acid:sodium symporter [Acetobacter thailandicus]